MSGHEGGRNRRVAVLAAGAVLAALPALRMVGHVRAGTRVQFNDYWPIMADTLRPDGGFALSRILEFRNEHPVAVARVLYWLNYRLTDGSNISLGLVVVGVVLLQLVVLASLVRSTPGLQRVHRVVAVVAASALLFAPFGAWSFLKAMSGTAWLTANLFALLAVWARTRHGRWWPLLPAVAAMVSYGTGLAAWPVLIVVGWVRDRRLRPQWPAALGGLLATAWHVAHHVDGDSPGGARSGPLEAVRNALEIVGSPLAPESGGPAAALGALALVLGGIGTVLAVRRHGPSSAGFVGVATFGVLSALLIGGGRTSNLASFSQSRYSSPAAIVWIGAGVLLAAGLRARWWAAAPLVAAAVVATLTGATQVDRLLDLGPRQAELATAIRMDVADGSQRWLAFRPFPQVTATLRSAGHHPFDGRWDADCGRLWDRLAAGEITAPGSPPAGGITGLTFPRDVPGTVEVSGWVRDDTPLDCILVLDQERRVVGVGTPDLGPRRPGRRPFTALVRPRAGLPPTSVVIGRGRPGFERLPTPGPDPAGP